MKKYILLATLFLSFAAISQPITDTNQLRGFINAAIVPNNTRAITATVVNRAFNGVLNSYAPILQRFVDTLYFTGNTMYWRQRGVLYSRPVSSGSSLTYPFQVKRYLNGYGAFASLNTDSITEGNTNKYFTDARARTAISLTTTGSSGPATYNTGTGVLNIPSYSSSSAGGSTGQIQYNNAGSFSGSPLLYSDYFGQPQISWGSGGPFIRNDNWGAGNAFIIRGAGSYQTVSIWSPQLILQNSINAPYATFTPSQSVISNLAASTLSIAQGAGTGISFNGPSYGIGYGQYTNGTLLLKTNSDAAGIHSSAQFELRSNSKGSIPFPVMSTISRTAISGPANGLHVYDSDLKRLMYYNGTEWTEPRFLSKYLDLNEVTNNSIQINLRDSGKTKFSGIGVHNGGGYEHMQFHLSNVASKTDKAFRWHIGNFGANGNPVSTNDLMYLTQTGFYLKVPIVNDLNMSGNLRWANRNSVQTAIVFTDSGNTKFSGITMHSGGVFRDMRFHIQDDVNAQSTGVFRWFRGNPNGSINSDGQATDWMVLNKDYLKVQTAKGFIPTKLTAADIASFTPEIGATVFCTDCTANNGTTGVYQTYNSSGWQKHY